MAKHRDEMTDRHFGDRARRGSALSDLLGIRITRAEPDEVRGEMAVTPDLANRNGVLHGGALMSFADTLGGSAAFANLGPGDTTTTVESKTNFLRPVPIGEVATGICIPLKVGRSLMVFQTTILRSDGKPAAIVTQTQMTLPLPSAGGDGCA